MMFKELFVGLLMTFGLVGLYLNLLATMAIWTDSTLGLFQKYSQILVAWIIPFLGSCLALRLAFAFKPHSKLRPLVPWGFRSIILGGSKVRKSPDDSIHEFWGKGSINKEGYIGRNSRGSEVEIDE